MICKRISAELHECGYCGSDLESHWRRRAEGMLELQVAGPVGAAELAPQVRSNPMSMEEELQKIYDSEINFEITWLWDGGVDVKLGHGFTGYAEEGIPSLQAVIARHYPASKYNVERTGGTFVPKCVELPNGQAQSGRNE
jgi:hypothetical protein